MEMKLGPLALITCLDGVGEMTTLDLGTQRCEQPLQPFLQRNWLLFTRLIFAGNGRLCGTPGGGLWRHRGGVVVVAVHIITESTHLRLPCEQTQQGDKNPNVGRVSSPSNIRIHA